MSDDLWLVLRPFSIYDPKRGRQDLRPGTVANLDGRETADLARRNYIMRIAPAAPLFTDSPLPSAKPMKRQRSNDGSRREQPDHPRGSETEPRHHLDD